MQNILRSGEKKLQKNCILVNKLKKHAPKYCIDLCVEKCLEGDAWGSRQSGAELAGLEGDKKKAKRTSSSCVFFLLKCWVFYSKDLQCTPTMHSKVKYSDREG